MLKSMVGALAGLLVGALAAFGCGLAFGWIGGMTSLVVVLSVGALLGGVAGWVWPGLFLGTVLSFLDPDLFD